MIEDSINYWTKLVSESEETSLAESSLNSKIGKFIDDFIQEVSSILKESGNDEEEAKLKSEVYDIVSKLKTKEDLQRFIEVHDAEIQSKIEEIDGPVKSTAKKALAVIWKIVKYSGKIVSFCFKNLQSILILVLTVYVCVKFNITPAQAISKAFGAAQIIFKGAKLTVDGAAKGAEIYNGIQDGAADVGDAIGTFLGTHLPNIF